MSHILVGFITVLSAGTFHAHCCEVQAGLVKPYLLAASIRNNSAGTCMQEPHILITERKKKDTRSTK